MPLIAPARCFVAGTAVLSELGLRPIGGIRLGERIPANEKYADKDFLDISQDTVKIKLSKVNPDDSESLVEISLLRTKAWFKEHSVTLNDVQYVKLEVEELAIKGLAKVVSVEDYHGPTDGVRVTGTFTRMNNDLYKMSFASGESVITTGSHPFYSISVNSWTPAKDISSGDRLVTYNGETTIKYIEHIPGKERVYNFEVNGFHNYYVGQINLLAHNACPQAVIEKYGGVKLETGGYQFASRRDAMQAASEIIGNMGHPKDIIKTPRLQYRDIRNTHAQKQSLKVIGKATKDNSKYWVDHSMGHRYNDTPHINVQNLDLGVVNEHFYY